MRGAQRSQAAEKQLAHLQAVLEGFAHLVVTEEQRVAPQRVDAFLDWQSAIFVPFSPMLCEQVLTLVSEAPWARCWQRDEVARLIDRRKLANGTWEALEEEG